MRAAVYARVSTAGQEEGTSLDTQVDECTAKAYALGCTVDDSHILRDQGSGDDPDRQGMAILKAFLMSERVDVLVAHSPERVQRDPFELLVFLAFLEELGIMLEYVNGPSGSTPEDKVLQYMTGYFGQKERLAIMERSMRGKRRVAENGRLPIGTGAGLFGYDYDRQCKTRTVNSQEAKVVMRIFNEYAEGVSAYKITLDLNRDGCRTKRGNLWCARTVTQLLKNPAYKGETWYGRARHKKVRGGKIERTPLPREEWTLVEGFTPAIVPEALWQQVQDRLAMPKRRDRSQFQKYVLTGFARCSFCGTGLIGTSRHGSIYRYYSCRATRPTNVPATCNARLIRADKLESAVRDRLFSLVLEPKQLMETIREFLNAESTDIDDEIARLKREVIRAKEKERKLLDLYLSENIDAELLDSQIAPIKASRERWTLELQDWEDQKMAREQAHSVEKQIYEYAAVVRQHLEQQSFDGFQAALAAFNAQVVACKGSATLNVVVDPSFPTIGHTWACNSNRTYSFHLVELERVVKSRRPLVHHWVAVRSLKKGRSRVRRGNRSKKR